MLVCKGKKMGLKVTKFGGSSVADAIQIAKTRDIIIADSDRKYIIVSAPGKRYNEDNKITDLLYLCKTHIEHNLPYEQVFQVICDRFTAMAINLGTKIDLTKEFALIIDHLRKGASTDYIASRGEYLNAIITAAYLGFDFVDAAGMVHFDEKGKFLSEETNDSIKKELAKHATAVIPGFYGAMPNGEIKTFTRGGSDITGAIVARAVEADVYENWTDVSGFLMADPKVVPDAMPISRVSYKELRELSYMGASVLHEDAIYPVRLANIPINIKNTNIPDDPGTLITSQEGNASGRIVTGIAGSKDFTVIALYKNMMSSEKGFVRRILGIFEDNDVMVEHMPNGIDTLSIVVSSDLLDGKLDDILEEINRKLQPDTIDVFEHMALVATVGYGMSRRPGVSAKLFTALADAGINIRMIDQGSSEMNIIVGVENKDLDGSIKAIYNAFVSQV
jgi:aspartate kinase